MTAWNQAVAWLGLLGLAVFAALAAVLCLYRRKRMLRLADEELWPALVPEGRPGRIRSRLLLRVAVLALALAALARPRWGEQWEEIERRGLDIMVVLDVSRSMWAEDFRPNRLQHAKWGLRDLLPHLWGDRIGLVIFAGDTQVLCPLTVDHDAFRMLLDDARPELIARGGTAVGRGLETAIDVLGPPAESDRVILLISDGEEHEGDPQALVPRLRELDIRVFTVGVGDPAGALIPVQAGPGESGFLRDREGRVVQTRLDEPMLRHLAEATGGAYVRATPADFGLERIYREAMADLRRAQQEARRIRRLRERYQLFLGAALLLLGAEWVSASRFRGGPRGRQRTGVHTEESPQGRRPPVPPAARRGGPSFRAGIVSAVLVLLLGALSARASDAPRRMGEGLEAYERGDWSAALEAFDEAARLAPETRWDPARAHYNAALALARAGRYEEAVRRFDEAARTTDLDVQARALFNQGRSLAGKAEAQVGEGDPSGARETMEAALRAYERAMRLDPGDRDPKINHELTRRRIEEIEEMIPPQPEPQPEPDEEPDPDGEQEEPEEDGAPPETDDEEEPEDAPADPDPDSEAEPGEPEADPADLDPAPPEMSPEEAQQILDALREEEAAHREQVRPQPTPIPVEKDW